ncbi:hypothetical protein [Microbulbifer sp. ZKSA002]|uniref:hypothetical protein n=1 Tax=Microbulbifer sp. ZKSA002 TaxID=3243388 RepID=UPI00403A6152
MKSVENFFVNPARQIGKDVRSQLPVERSFSVGDIYCKYFFFDFARPLVVTFANAGFITPKKSVNDQGYSPWGFDFVKRLNCNVLAFSCIDEPSWYRGRDFQRFIQDVSSHLKVFPCRLGYAGSMGGYAVGAFASVMGLDRVLLLSPITTLSASILPSESEHRKSKSLDWAGDFADGADFDSVGYVVYDNLLRRDTLHANRYKNLKHLRVPGLGHGMPAHVHSMGMLKKLVVDFVGNSVDEVWFRRCARRRKFKLRYFNELLQREELLTPGRIKVLKKYRRAVLAYRGEGAFGDNFINALRMAAERIEAEDLELSYRLLAGASVLRPEGARIKKKLKQYKAELEKDAVVQGS